MRIEEETKSRDPKAKVVDSSKVNVAEASKFQKNFKVNNNKTFKKSGNGQQKFSGIASFVERNAIDKMTTGSRRKRRKLTQTKPILLKRESKKHVLWYQKYKLECHRNQHSCN